VHPLPVTPRDILVFSRLNLEHVTVEDGPQFEARPRVSVCG
jgi:hypothetical protein